MERLSGGLGFCGDGHDEAVQEEIATRKAMFPGGVKDGAKGGEALFRRLRDAVLGEGQTEDGRAVFFRQGEEAGDALRLGADGIDEGAAGVDPKSRFQGVGVAGVDGEGRGGDLRDLHNGPSHGRRLVDAGDTHVDV